MRFKTSREEDQFQGVSLVLKLVAYDLDAAIKSLDKEMFVTRVTDAVTGESGVHLDKRAIDVRDEHEGKKLFTPQEISFLLRFINDKWQRNDGLQTMIHHRFQGGPFHLHVQIPVSTKVFESNKLNKSKEGTPNAK